LHYGFNKQVARISTKLIAFSRDTLVKNLEIYTKSNVHVLLSQSDRKMASPNMRNMLREHSTATQNRENAKLFHAANCCLST